MRLRFRRRNRSGLRGGVKGCGWWIGRNRGRLSNSGSPVPRTSGSYSADPAGRRTVRQCHILIQYLSLSLIIFYKNKGEPVFFFFSSHFLFHFKMKILFDIIHQTIFLKKSNASFLCRVLFWVWFGSLWTTKKERKEKERKKHPSLFLLRKSLLSHIIIFVV